MDELSAFPPAGVPDELAELWPLVRRFGVSDDVIREERLDACSDRDLQELVRRVDRPTLKAINRYLDDTRDSQESVPYGDLAQAAIEAGLLLEARRGTK